MLRVVLLPTVREEALSQECTEQALKEKGLGNVDGTKEIVHQLVTAGHGDFKSE